LWRNIASLSVFLHRSVLRGSDHFTATGCDPKVRLSSL
jgi:hypothetical protein